MFNILDFIRKYYYVLLFLLFESIALLLTGGRQVRPRAFFVNSSNFFTSAVYNNIFKVTEYFNLKEDNEKLLKENRELKNYAQYLDSLHSTIEVDTLRDKQYEFIYGKVVKNSVLYENNFITINRGSADGVVPDMGVISPDGVVGIVTNVSKHYCVVLSVLNNLNSIGCKLKNSSYFGSASWDGKNYKQVILDGIPNHVQVLNGDTVLTSGFGTIFPDNIIVGTVDSLWKKPENNFYTIRVNLGTDLKRLTNVYLVKNIYLGEQQKLEEQKDDLL